MSERINRRELILEEATRLFGVHGYASTSVRQIADAVGCTEAALYYHFKEGKRALLQAVVEREFPNLDELAAACEGATTLPDLFKRFGGVMKQMGRVRLERMRWLIAEFPLLSQEERDLLHQRHFAFHERMSGILAPFLSPVQANSVAWLLLCSGIGYGQLFWNLDLCSKVDFSVDDLTDSYINLMGTTC